MSLKELDFLPLFCRQLGLLSQYLGLVYEASSVKRKLQALQPPGKLPSALLRPSGRSFSQQDTTES